MHLARSADPASCVRGSGNLRAVELQHSFSVPVDVDRAWAVLVDIDAGCALRAHGAALDTVDGDEFTGSVKVRLGPIGITYKGKAPALARKDEAAHRAVIDAQEGKDARGNGTASATVTATLHPQGRDGTRVEVNTDLAITGKPAQFGRGVMVDVRQQADRPVRRLPAPANWRRPTEPAPPPRRSRRRGFRSAAGRQPTGQPASVARRRFGRGGHAIDLMASAGPAAASSASHR